MSAPDRNADAESVGNAKYVFSVEFRLDPGQEGVSVEPHTFETTMFRQADPPGEEGWLFFRDNLWRAELNEPQHFNELTSDVLDVEVYDVEFKELRTDAEYLDALRVEIGDDLDLFRADTVEEVLSKYLGSSIHVMDPAEDT